MVRQGSGEDAVAPGCESSDAVEKTPPKKVRPTRFQRLVVEAASPDASKPVKKRGSGYAARSRQTGWATFSSPG